MTVCVCESGKNLLMFVASCILVNLRDVVQVTNAAAIPESTLQVARDARVWNAEVFPQLERADVVHHPIVNNAGL